MPPGKKPPEKSPRENCPRKINPRKYAPGKLPPGKLSPGNIPPGKLPPGQLPLEKLFFQIFVAFDIILPLFLLKLFRITNVTKSSCLDVAGVVDLPQSLLGEVFQRYVSVRHIAQLVAHGKTAKIAKSVLCKIIARKDIIFNKQFPASTIYCEVLIYLLPIYRQQ